MSSLNEVYGKNYHQDALQLRRQQLVDLITNNISHREFVFHLDSCENIWEDNHLAPDVIDQICQSVPRKNSCLTIKRINLSRPDHRAMLPYLIENEPAEYFYIVDREFNRYYVIFITPSLMGAF